MCIMYFFFISCQFTLACLCGLYAVHIYCEHMTDCFTAHTVMWPVPSFILIVLIKSLWIICTSSWKKYGKLSSWVPFQWTVCGEVPSWWPCSEQNVLKDTLWCLFSGNMQFSAISSGSYSLKNEHALPSLLISLRDHCVTLCQDLVSRSKFHCISPSYGKILNLRPFCPHTTVPGHSGDCNSMDSPWTTIQLHGLNMVQKELDTPEPLFFVFFFESELLLEELLHSKCVFRANKWHKKYIFLNCSLGLTVFTPNANITPRKQRTFHFSNQGRFFQTFALWGDTWTNHDGCEERMPHLYPKIATISTTMADKPHICVVVVTIV